MKHKIKDLEENLSESVQARKILECETDLIKEELVSLRSENLKQKDEIGVLSQNKVKSKCFTQSSSPFFRTLL